MKTCSRIESMISSSLASDAQTNCLNVNLAVCRPKIKKNLFDKQNFHNDLEDKPGEPFKVKAEGGIG